MNAVSKKFYIPALYLVLMVVGFAVGARKLSTVADIPLQDDASEYRGIALNMTHAFDTKHREPFWIWYVALSHKILGESDMAARISGLMLFLINGLLIARLGFLWTNRPLLGFLAGLVYLVKPYNSWLGTEAMRDLMVLTATLLLFNLGVSKWQTLLEKRRLVFWICLVMLVGCGTRVTLALPYFLVTVCLFWRFKVSWKALLWPAVTILAIVGPHLYNNHQVYGDAMHSVNFQVRRAAVFEGTQQCPTCTHIDRPQERITGFSYTFEQRSLWNLVHNVSLGYFNLTFRPSQNLYFNIVAGFGVVVMLAMGYWQIPLGVMLVLNLLPLTQPMLSPPRVFHVYEIVRCLGVAFAVVPFAIVATLGLERFLRKGRIQPFFIPQHLWRKSSFLGRSSITG